MIFLQLNQPDKFSAFYNLSVSRLKTWFLKHILQHLLFTTNQLLNKQNLFDFILYCTS